MKAKYDPKKFASMAQWRSFNNNLASVPPGSARKIMAKYGLEPEDTHIGFSHRYSKLHTQTAGELIRVDRVTIGKDFSEITRQYDTDGVFPLPDGDYLRLLFLGNLGIPFTTYRIDDEEHRNRFCGHEGDWFRFNFKEESNENNSGS